ncbi:MAG: HAMP domain-containing histidine kinase [Peptococcaceae bacterium]|nr:HAMP domain-containing histidine kinase [Peptococcaceae bacterium]
MGVKTKIANRVRWIQSLRGQLVVRFLLCFVVFIILITAFQYQALRTSLYQTVREGLRSDAAKASTEYLTRWFTQDEGVPQEAAAFRRNIFMVALNKDRNIMTITTDFGGRNTAETVENAEKAENAEPVDEYAPFMKEDWRIKLAGIADSPSFFIYVSPEPHQRYMLYNCPVYADPDTLLGYALFGMPLADTERMLANMMRNIIVVSLGVLVVSVLVIRAILRKPLNPMRSMSFTARQIAEGRYDLRLEGQGGPREIVHLRDALNHMLQELDDALQTERIAREEMARFIADASHELRTPMTSIRGFLEILLRDTERDSEVLREVHTSMLTEINRLIRLAEALLMLNRLAQFSLGTEMSEEPTDTDTDPRFLRAVNTPGIFYNDVVGELQPVLAPLLKGRTLVWSPLPEDIPFDIPLTRDHAKQVLLNLVTNAIQHTPPEGCISIEAHRIGSGMLTVSDNGSGIAEKDLPHVFERFFRGDRSRTHNKLDDHGSGLGLAIVNEIVRLCGGCIRVNSTVGVGSTFVVVFAQEDDVPEDLMKLHERAFAQPGPEDR